MPAQDITDEFAEVERLICQAESLEELFGACAQSQVCQFTDIVPGDEAMDKQFVERLLADREALVLEARTFAL